MNSVDHKERDAKKVAQMFSSIADRYDLLNHVLSLGLDIGWRKKVAEETGNVECQRILDVCGAGQPIRLRFWRAMPYRWFGLSRELIAVGRQKSGGG
jgi:demethylmenaquinone methyltransferase/2-methoxy-6-polyprenyl-1,4-benzoquinol methylase